MSIVEQLIDMGFEKEAAEEAIKAGHTSLENAMDWIVAKQESGASTGEETKVEDMQANSFKCME